MNLHVPPELEAKLIQLASETGRTTEDVALHLLTSAVDHDVWFKRQVETGRLSGRDRHLPDHHQIGSRE